MYIVTRLRILHLSDSSLPDWRIEKSATTALNEGHEVVFAGGMPINYNKEIFSAIYEVKWLGRRKYGFLSTGLPPYWHSVRKQVERVIREARPDIVHAHNIFPAKMISEFGVPFVYDNHEYWSVYVKRLSEAAMSMLDSQKSLRGGIARRIARRTLRKIIWWRTIRLWTRWEKEIVSNNPTITVSDTIAEELRTISNNTKDVFVVPNYPMRSEIQDFKKPEFHDKLSSVYAGVEVQGTVTPTHRNIEGLVETFDSTDIGDLAIIGITDKPTKHVNYLGFLSRHSMFQEMFNHSIGLIPFKRHWSHVYISPNKAYEYPHAGLVVMTTSGFKPVKEILEDHCITFEDYSDMTSKLMHFKENLNELYKRRLRIFDYAREKLIWENNEHKIIEAYKRCA